MQANESTIMTQLPDPAALRQRLSQLTAERNLVKDLLRVFERQGFRGNPRRCQRPCEGNVKTEQ